MTPGADKQPPPSHSPPHPTNPPNQPSPHQPLRLLQRFLNIFRRHRTTQHPTHILKSHTRRIHRTRARLILQERPPSANKSNLQNILRPQRLISPILTLHNHSTTLHSTYSMPLSLGILRATTGPLGDSSIASVHVISNSS